MFSSERNIRWRSPFRSISPFAIVRWLLPGVLCASGVYATVQLDMQLGFDPQTPLLRQDTWSPVSVILRNNGPDVDGILRIRTRSSGSQYGPATEHPLALPKNSTKQIRDIVLVNRDDEMVAADLIVKGKADASANVPFQFADPFSRTVLIVGDEAWVRQIKTITRDQPRTLRPLLYATKLEMLPDSAFAYEGMDTVILDQAEWTRMNPRQAQALRLYVRRGGNLVVSTGRNANSVGNSALADLLPVVLEQTQQASDLIRPLPNVSPIRNDRSLLLCRALPKTNTVLRILAEDNRHPLTAEAPLGLGRVTFLAFQLSDPIVQAWPDKVYLWQFLFAPRFTPLIETGTDDFHRLIEGALETNALLPLPTSNQIGLLLLIYVGGAIPLNHLLWRLLKRPIWAWGLVPLLSIGLGGTMILNERIVTRGALSLTEIMIAHARSGRTTALGDGFLSLQSGSSDRFSVCVTNETVAWSPILGREANFAFRLQPDIEPGLLSFDLLRRGSAHFEATRTLPLRQGIEMRLQWKDGSVTGQILNHSGLTFLQNGLLGPVGPRPSVAILADSSRETEALAGALSAESRHVTNFVQTAILPLIDSRDRIVFWGIVRGASPGLELIDRRGHPVAISHESRWTLLLCAAPFELDDGPFEVSPPHWRVRVIGIRSQNGDDMDDAKPLLGRDISVLSRPVGYYELAFEAQPDVELGIDPALSIQQMQLYVHCDASSEIRLELFNRLANAWESIPGSLSGSDAVKYLHPRNGTLLLRLLGGGAKELKGIQIKVTGQRGKRST